MQNTNLHKELVELPDYGIHIGSHHHGPDFHGQLHCHRHGSLLYIASGRGKGVFGDKSFELGANSVVFLPGQVAHKLEDYAGSAMTVFVVYFSRESLTLPDEILDDLLVSVKPISVGPHRVQSIRRGLRQMLSEQEAKPIQYEAVLQNLLGQIMLELYRIVYERSDEEASYANDSLARVNLVLEYVAQHHYQPQSLAIAAKMAQLSQRRFSSLCRQISGRSFTQYINQIRVRRAHKLLESTDMPITAIAFEVGFEELSTFYRAFRKHYSNSPKAIRKGF